MIFLIWTCQTHVAAHITAHIPSRPFLGILMTAMNQCGPQRDQCTLQRHRALTTRIALSVTRGSCKRRACRLRRRSMMTATLVKEVAICPRIVSAEDTSRCCEQRMTCCAFSVVSLFVRPLQNDWQKELKWRAWAAAKETAAERMNGNTPGRGASTKNDAPGKSANKIQRAGRGGNKLRRARGGGGVGRTAEGEDDRGRCADGTAHVDEST